ncbi:MAG: hypothetical protein FWE67_02490 [Planctomycetaceae bacterium]|nr:hypothetical protein [Planctomycetaceae bacterium]
MKISNASKSMDSTSLAQVRDENDNVFQDVSLTVAQPWFYTPFQTSVTEIELNVIANAESGTISFAPLPGVMQKLEYAAVDEVFAEVLSRIDIKEHTRIYKGKPIVK